ncbi:hypothetical protein CH251_14035 [Rhodococcus sp. 06-462-5]|uniref:hypothetical protein n=1 Tax=unclassified Rhodococcus (in: high G+C Gram-positive bacteria) TaxID=192944 RepID=UPI000B9B47DC|nr:MULTISPECIES: hypothetical protein [unclassified Rhodococcus (in: high G+C Gram-positive bacteria)]OZC73647.1 hypothetical protein CH251_14035 [Rhodococcus sp. 06-462-5]OZE63456.1 hypothetical protein CH270_18410 [Rhodococcus sp. 02-925g]
MTQLADQWARLLLWCDANAPVTAAGLNPPAEPRIARDAESATGRTWTPELREWFALHNGSDQGKVFPQVLAGHRPMIVAELVVDRRSLVGIWAETTTALEEIEGRQLMADPAGTTAFTYLPSFIPIATDNTRCRLVVDTRDGDAAGRVVGFASDDVVDEGTMRWPSIGAMLHDVADSLETSHPCKGWVPFVEDGELYWDFP